MDASNEYLERINRVIDYLRDNLDKSFKLKELACVACFSEFHFHRVFSAITGETVNNFTNRLRLEKSTRLLRYKSLNITEIALECGFSSSSTFSRSFSKSYGLSPKEYRNSGKIKDSKICKELFPEYKYILSMTDEEKKEVFPVQIKKFPAWNIGYIRVSDAYNGDRVLRAFDSVVEWAKGQGIYDSGILFGMSLDDPSVTPKHLYRYEACFSSEQEFNCLGAISRMEIPAKTYAVIRVRGNIKQVATAWDYLFGSWLIKSNFEPDHAPALEIFLNKSKATDWSIFELDLCLPIKKII